jgi:hypothetical protein
MLYMNSSRPLALIVQVDHTFPPTLLLNPITNLYERILPSQNLTEDLETKPSLRRPPGPTFHPMPRHPRQFRTALSPPPLRRSGCRLSRRFAPRLPSVAGQCTSCLSCSRPRCISPCRRRGKFALLRKGRWRGWVYRLRSSSWDPGVSFEI